MASVSTAQHQQRIAQARRRRLEELELREAALGLETPPSIANEIEDLRSHLAGGSVVLEPISDDDRYHATMRAVMLLSQQLAAVEVKVDRLMWLLPAMMFAFLVLVWLVEHL